MNSSKTTISIKNPELNVVFGLGNPTDRYKGTRHNIGAMTLDRLVTKHGTLETDKGIYRVSPHILAVKSVNNFMNESGDRLKEIYDQYSNFYDLVPIVIYDDLDLPLGVLRVKSDGSDGGHRGLRSVISYLGHSDFLRIKIGIGRPENKQDVLDYVLSRFTDDELKLIDDATSKAAEAVEMLITGDIEATMRTFN